MIAHPVFKNIKAEHMFQLFKYSIFALITVNLFYFIFEEMSASAHTFREGMSITDMANAFATSIDTVAWFALLVIFDLETYVLSEKTLKGRLKWVLSGIVAVCYVFIIIAFLGFVHKMGMVYDFVAIAGAACDQLGIIPSYAMTLDEYRDLTAEACAAMGNAPIYVNASGSIIATEDVLSMMKKLTMTDVINSGTWLLVVLVLQVDVIMQLRGDLSDRFYKISLWAKGLIYTTLVICCAYWTYLGSGINAWDSFLWIVAFVFIELNLFKWHENDEHEKEAQA